jgi:hypothetical protein
MSAEPRESRRSRALTVVFWILAVLMMTLAWAGVSLKELLFPR